MRLLYPTEKTWVVTGYLTSEKGTSVSRDKIRAVVLAAFEVEPWQRKLDRERLLLDL